jgi:hypothetical protein
LLSPVSLQIVAQDSPLLRGAAILPASTVTRGRPIRFAGRGLILEISPFSFPNLSAVLRGRTPRWKRPIMIQLYQTLVTKDVPF